MGIETRKISLEILNKLYENFSVEESINKNKKFHKLSEIDKAFIKMIILMFLRRNGEVDEIISNVMSKPLKKKNNLIINILRIAITQIIFTNVKDYSAVDSAVEITKKKVFGYQNLVNAILRKVCNQKTDFISRSEPIKNIPFWLRKSWENDYGKIRVKKIAKEIIKLPSLDINIRKNEFKKKNWNKILDGKNIFKKIIRKTTHKGEISQLPFYKEGKWWIQSLSSSIPVEIIYDFYKKKIFTNNNILEIGSAPGGKTIQLLDYGFDVTAIEISKKRIKKLKANLNRLQLNTKIINEDILNWSCKSFYECALIDAPCSGSGIIRKKPEILINKHKENLNYLINKQALILEKVSKIITVNGLIVYTVCSIEKDEGEKQIKKFLLKNKNFRKLNINNKIFCNVELTNKLGMIEITPEFNKEIGGIDGFFIASLQRIY